MAAYKIQDKARLKTSIALNLVGDKELQEKLRRLGDDVLQKIMKPIGGRAIKEAVDAVRNATPEDKKAKKPTTIHLRGGKYERANKMKDAIKTASANPSNKAFGAIAKLWFDIKEPNVAVQAMMLEYGTKSRKTGSGKNRGAIQPIGFLSKAMADCRDKVLNKLTEEAQKSLTRYLKKLDKEAKKKSAAEAKAKKATGATQ